MAVGLGDSGMVDVTVFTDFQCPFCAAFDSALTDLAARRPGLIRRSVVHFPMPGNAHAFPAAVAFECAARSGRSRSMHQTLYAEQRNRRLSLGLWADFAGSAGVDDRSGFVACVADTASHRRILDGIRLGDALTIRGTPTVVVSDWLVEPSTVAMVEAAIDAVLSGKQPPAAVRKQR